jgi:hypothetical protein
VSLAPRTRVAERAVKPVAMMKLRRFIEVDTASILAERGRGRKRSGAYQKGCRN